MKIGDVSRITGVRDVTLSRWLDRETIKPSRADGRSRGTGDHRTFSRATINTIAIARQSIKLGMISAAPAIAAAQLFTEQGQPGRAPNKLFEFGLTVMIHTEGKTSIRNLDPDASLSEAFGRNFDSYIAVNIGPIIKNLDKLISTTKKDTK
jgi:hypothetical protein